MSPAKYNLIDMRASTMTMMLVKSIRTTNEFESKIFQKYPYSVEDQKSLQVYTDLVFEEEGIKKLIWIQAFIFCIGFIWPLSQQIFSVMTKEEAYVSHSIACFTLFCFYMFEVAQMRIYGITQYF